MANCYSRLERAMLSIIEEKERAPKYCITLWWGFAGLREREDGVWLWISRRDMNANIAPISTGVLQTPILWANNIPVLDLNTQNLATVLLRYSRNQTQNEQQEIIRDYCEEKAKSRVRRRKGVKP